MLGFLEGFKALPAQLPADPEFPVGMWLQAVLPGVLISAGAACFGAYQRLH